MEGGISSAAVITMDGSDDTTEYAVEIVFADDAAELFAEITSMYIGEQNGIYVDDEMISNPAVYSVITDGRCQIAGFTYDEATLWKGF